MEYILKHHGVKGMRWGFRKATATDKRQINDAGTATQVGKSVSEGIKNSTGITKGIAGLFGGPSKKLQQEMSQMSDAELRAKINRQTMEQQYANLNPNKVQRGASIAQSILDIAGGVGALAGSAAAVYLAIKKCRLTDLKK